MNNSIVTAVFGGFKTTRTRDLWQWDHGMTLVFKGLSLPEHYTVHFANQPMSGTAKKQLGDDQGVTILDEYLTTGLSVYAWVYLHDGETDGETVYMVEIPVKKRPQPTEEPPTPVQQDVIEQAIAALNAAVTQTEQDAVYAGASADAAAESEENARQSESNAYNSAQSASHSETNAQRSEQAAARSAENAQASAERAEASEQESKTSERNAELSADRAEQAAQTAGYMFIEIDADGHLSYTRTDQVDADFSLSDGHLILEAI